MKSFAIGRRLIAGLALFATTLAMTTPCAASETSKEALEDIKLYFTAPLRWDSRDWLYFGSTIAAVSIAHRYDDDVRTHFIVNQPGLATDTNSHGLSDAAPAAAAFFGTWAFSVLSDDSNGRREAWNMAEATALSTTTELLLKFAAGRERPNETADANRWRAGGDSFPSLHVTAAFAIGTVLAESGNDEYRWVRRVLGYGIGVASSYQRLKHNQHWLSDTVAGAALGMSSAHFAMNRGAARKAQANIAVVPIDGGVLLAYSLPLH